MHFTRDIVTYEVDMINIENVSKFIIRDISLHIPKGEVTGLIGATGSGKTTLVRLASGLLLPDCGRVSVMGHEPVRFKGKFGSRLSVLISGVKSLSDEETAVSALDGLRIIYGIPKNEYEKRYRKLAERFDFSSYENERLKGLSVGQRRRVELAGAFLTEPELMILDEPEVGLDEFGKQALEEIIKEKTGEGMTLLITSHNMAEISNICTRIAVLSKGDLIFYGSEDALRSRYQPINTLTVSFDGNIPNIDDLPIVRYRLEGNTASYEYNSMYITASEVLDVIMKQTRITDINIKKPDLEQIIINMRKSEGKDEFYRSRKHQ